MKEIYSKNKLFFGILFVVITGFLMWYFREIIICIVVAGVISIIGFPLVDFLEKISYRRIKVPRALAVVFTLLLFIVLFIGLLSFFVPLIIHEATIISTIDPQALINYYAQEIHWLEYNMTQLGILKKGVTIETLLKSNFTRLLDFGMFTNIISGVISFTGTFFFNVFTILFLSFFFLYDKRMLPKFILGMVPEQYFEKTKNVMSKSKVLLSRYFIGLILNVLVMIISYIIALTLVGAKSAIVIAFFAGIINIVPYIGPFIGVITGVLLGVTGMVGEGLYGDIWTMAIKISIAMTAVILLDNLLYGPYIQGRSVRAHPVEIFLVIIAAGSIGGIPTMIVAVPGYAFLRIVAGEFLSQFRVVRSLTK